jgi:methanogenic corrinoid protein MtbC1
LKGEGQRTEIPGNGGRSSLNQEYADKIGADAYSEDARAAVLTAQRLMGILNK